MILYIISRLVILLFGTLYPAYASYKAVEMKKVKAYEKWMMYWIVFALFTCAETFTDIFLRWFPFYYEIKIVLILWLLPSTTTGSSILYRKFVHPMLSGREHEIDEYISNVKELSYKQLLDLGSWGVNALMQTPLKNLSQIPLMSSRSSMSSYSLSNGQDELGGIKETTEAGAVYENTITKSKLGGIKETVGTDAVYEETITKGEDVNCYENMNVPTTPWVGAVTRSRSSRKVAVEKISKKDSKIEYYEYSA